MKQFWTVFFLAILISFKVQAAEDDPVKLSPGNVLFEGVQEHCVEVGEITFGLGKQWSNCHILRARWLVTIDLIDMYQTQYCLGHDEQSCEQHAWVVFANRAYTKEAKPLVVRMDPSTTVYKDPLVIVTGEDRLMSMTSTNADGVESTNYYLWHTDHWMPFDAKSWLPKLSKQLPKGTSIRQPVWPDLESMSTEVNLFKSGDKDCCPTGGKAKVELGFENENFLVKHVSVSTETQ